MPGGRKQYVTLKCRDGATRSFLTPMWRWVVTERHKGKTEAECGYECGHCGNAVLKPLVAHSCPINSGGRHVILKTSVMKCPVCEDMMHLYIAGDRQRHYGCPNCGHDEKTTEQSPVIVAS